MDCGSAYSGVTFHHTFLKPQVLSSDLILITETKSVLIRAPVRVKDFKRESADVAGQFGAKSTTEEVLAGISLKGKRILVTGVSAGLGVETARALVAHGADVVGAARDLEKAKRATSEVSKAAVDAGASLELIELDLASLKSIRAAAGDLSPMAGYLM